LDLEKKSQNKTKEIENASEKKIDIPMSANFTMNQNWPA
jgi:hypothetical protein